MSFVGLKLHWLLFIISLGLLCSLLWVNDNTWRPYKRKGPLSKQCDKYLKQDLPKSFLDFLMTASCTITKSLEQSIPHWCDPRGATPALYSLTQTDRRSVDMQQKCSPQTVKLGNWLQRAFSPYFTTHSSGYWTWQVQLLMNVVNFTSTCTRDCFLMEK